MENLILLIVAMAALCCMATNTVMIFKLLHQKQEPAKAEPEKNPEEKERERLALERYRLETEGVQNMMAYTGFGFKNRGERE